jgi:preprotein translocase subunit SecY
MESTLAGSRTLWSRLLVTLAVVVVYRVGVWIPLPGISQEQLQQLFPQLK